MIDHASSLLTSSRVTELPHQLQGFCSYTLTAVASIGHGETAQIIIQFRPAKFALDPSIAQDAKDVYGEYAPLTRELGHFVLSARQHLQVTIQTCVPGIPYSQLLHKTETIDGAKYAEQKRLVTSFADFLARGWYSGRSGPHRLHLTGKVGRSLSQRLGLLSQHLPNTGLREQARTALETIHHLECLPTVLTHGDILNSNFMVNTTTFSIQGFIDWAEAEWLPFGVGFHGLEHLLGYVSEGDGRFVYYFAAPELRRCFWDELECRIRQLTNNQSLRRAIELARDIGTLLWHGFAWDNGAIDRIINPIDDPVELMYLQTFLGVAPGSTSARL